MKFMSTYLFFDIVYPKSTFQCLNFHALINLTFFGSSSTSLGAIQRAYKVLALEGQQQGNTTHMKNIDAKEPNKNMAKAKIAHSVVCHSSALVT